MAITWQSNQNRAVRDTVAWYRFGYPQADTIVEFRRQDIRQPGYIEGLDGWGSITETGATMVSVWVDPIGRKFATLNEAIRQVRHDRLAAVRQGYCTL